MSAQDVLARMAARLAHAEQVAATFVREQSPVRKLSEAKRGNAGLTPAPSDVDKVFAATLRDEIGRAKASVKRFGS